MTTSPSPSFLSGGKHISFVKRPVAPSPVPSTSVATTVNKNTVSRNSVRTPKSQHVSLKKTSERRYVGNAL